MRQFNEVLLSAADASQATLTSTVTMDISFCDSMSFHAVSTGTMAGTLKVQVSNDTPKAVGSPSNWVDVPSATVSITNAGNWLIGPLVSAYNFARVVYTKTSSTGSPTLTVTSKALGKT